MISEDAVKKRLAALGPIDKMDAVLSAAGPALREAAGSGAWVTIKTARNDAGLVNRAKSAELDRRLIAQFGPDGEEGEDAPEVALEALARAIAAEAAETGGADKVALGDETYELKIMDARRGGRARVRLRNPDAAPVDAPEEGEQEADGDE